MTRSRNRQLLSLERLESRDCPTLNVIFTGGNLFILGRPDVIPFDTTHPDNGLDIQVTSATGQVTVTEREGGLVLQNFGTYLVRNNLYIGLANYNSDINVDLNGNRLDSNLIMNLGLGDVNPLAETAGASPNPISIYSSDTMGAPSVAGNITILNGSGVEDLYIGHSGAESMSLAPGPVSAEGIVVDGNVSVNLPNRIDDVNPLSVGDILNILSTTDIRGNVNTTGVDNVNIGEVVANDSTTIQGNLSISDAGSLNELVVHDNGAVNGNLTVQGSEASGFFEQDALFIGAGPVGGAYVGGNVTANLTASNDLFLVLNPATTFAGNVSYTGAGVSTVVLSDATFLGDVAVNVGSGDNLVSSNGTFNGNLTVTGGDGDNNLIALSPTVAGNLTLNLGNGDNNVAFGGSLNGGTLTSTTGNGDDNVSFGGTGTYALNAHLGSGANTLSFDGDPLSSADIVFATHVATDSLTQTGTINGPFSLVNFP
jgi:hypothetical protein